MSSMLRMNFIITDLEAFIFDIMFVAFNMYMNKCFTVLEFVKLHWPNDEATWNKAMVDKIAGRTHSVNTIVSSLVRTEVP